jgi:hypothetical protein
MGDSKGSVRALRAINHNSLHSLKFQIGRGGLFDGEARANMEVFDQRCKAIAMAEHASDQQNLQNLQRQELWVKTDCGS